MKKVRDGSRNINAYAESNLSSVRDIRSFFDTEAGGLQGGGGGAAPPGKWRLFLKMPSASCIIEIHCLLFAKGATVGFSVCLWVDVYVLIRGSAE